MNGLPDRYWAAASSAALKALDEASYVLVPDEFLRFDRRFIPIEYAWGLRDIERLAWCVSKDDVDRLPPWLHGDRAQPATYLWANEVFVLGGGFRWRQKADANTGRHLPAWHERVERYRAGNPARANAIRTVATPPGFDSSSGKRALIVGASGMGNIGDDLLAEVLVQELMEEGVAVDLSGPAIDPLHLRGYDALIVGGGGLIYASRDGANEMQNLANYLKFGPVGEYLGIPTALIGVGDQDHAGGIGQHELSTAFVRSALPLFHQVTTRDAASASFLRRLGAPHAQASTDLLFAWAQRAGNAIRPTGAVPPRIAIAGDAWRFPVFAAGFAPGNAYLAEAVRGLEYELLIMSNDDVQPVEHARQALQQAGASVAIVDTHGRSFEELQFLFASFRSVVTARFHGLVLAALAGTPVLALDVEDGKKSRLLRELDLPDLLAAEDEAADRERLKAALRGEGAPVPAELLDDLAEQTEVHRRALRDLLGLDDAVLATRRAKAGRRSPSLETPLRPADLEALLLQPDGESLGLCWAASSRATSGHGNLGDSLSAVIVAALAGRKVRHINFDARETKLVAVGSIGHAIRHGTGVFWGSGVSIRGGVLAGNVPHTRYDVRALRGAISAQHFRDFGIDVPPVFGDPVWFLPSIFTEPVPKQYELGVIPHIQDIDGTLPGSRPKPDSLRYQVEAADSAVAIINTWHEPTWAGLQAKLRLILSCKRILSQSFHGLVIAEAFGIPALNFRQVPGVENPEVLEINLDEPCTVDPRVFEFYAGGPRRTFPLFAQRRDRRSDWTGIIREIDRVWTPFAYDAAPLLEAFPLLLAYDPLRETAPNPEVLASLAF